jgi:light-regulated signal transduction histidine kinase (bacteriophytochrome)
VTEPVARLEREYVDAVEAYIKQGNESALSRAYELGRRAMTDGRGVLDMATLHRAALQALVIPAAPADRPRLAQAAAEFFHELLSPFEMSFRGYRSANAELQRLNATLVQQKEAVESANRELEAFNYSVSHDLRAPLRSIDGFSQIVLDDFSDALGQEGKKYLQRVRDAAQHMGRLIEDLLSLSRVSRTELHRTNVDLSALAHQIADGLRSTAPHRDTAFIIEDDVHANGDAGLLTVLLQNLLGNAWKFTSKRKAAQISFGYKARGTVPRYFVTDNGAGFDMAHASRLFGAFQRLHAASEFEGTGIGLATVQRVVRRHHGQVWGEGKVDGGATFTFTLGAGHHGSSDT